MKTPVPCRRFLVNPWVDEKCFWCNWHKKDHSVRDELPELEFEVTFWETVFDLGYPEDWPDN